MANQSSWFPVKMFSKEADTDCLFGPCLQAEVHNYLYPKEKVKKNETVIWNPVMHKSISLKAYEKAHQTQDQEALCKISRLGIPLGLTFGGAIDLKG